MGNTPSAPYNNTAPPRYEEHIAKPVKPSNSTPGRATDCLCHSRFSDLACQVDAFGKQYLERNCSTFAYWECGRLNKLAGTTSNSCDVDCRCHEDYALLAYRIQALYDGIPDIRDQLEAKGQDRSVDEFKSWERHAGDIGYLFGMLRNCSGRQETSAIRVDKVEELE